MENLKVTKGEWGIYKFDGEVHITDESNIQSICKLPPKYEHTEANAKLIAASKDLLEALVELSKIVKNAGHDLWIEQSGSTDAINKATL